MLQKVGAIAESPLNFKNLDNVFFQINLKIDLTEHFSAEPNRTEPSIESANL